MSPEQILYVVNVKRQLGKLVSEFNGNICLCLGFLAFQHGLKADEVKVGDISECLERVPLHHVNHAGHREDRE